MLPERLRAEESKRAGYKSFCLSPVPVPEFMRIRFSAYRGAQAAITQKLQFSVTSAARAPRPQHDVEPHRLVGTPGGAGTWRLLRRGLQQLGADLARRPDSTAASSLASASPRASLVSEGDFLAAYVSRSVTYGSTQQAKVIPRSHRSGRRALPPRRRGHRKYLTDAVCCHHQFALVDALTHPRGFWPGVQREPPELAAHIRALAAQASTAPALRPINCAQRLNDIHAGGAGGRQRRRNHRRNQQHHRRAGDRRNPGIPISGAWPPARQPGDRTRAPTSTPRAIPAISTLFHHHALNRCQARSRAPAGCRTRASSSADRKCQHAHHPHHRNQSHRCEAAEHQRVQAIRGAEQLRRGMFERREPRSTTGPPQTL